MHSKGISEELEVFFIQDIAFKEVVQKMSGAWMCLFH